MAKAKSAPTKLKAMTAEQIKELQKEADIVKEIVGDKTQPKKQVREEPVQGHGDDEYRIEIVDDENFRKDITHLEHQDPGYVYRWLKDEQKNLSMKTSNALHQKGGWQLVPKAHMVKLGYDEQFISPDGWFRRGDTILARMPKELFARKEEVKKKRATAPMDAVQRMINKGDPQAAAGIHNTMKGIQTKETLKGNWKE